MTVDTGWLNPSGVTRVGWFRDTGSSDVQALSAPDDGAASFVYRVGPSTDWSVYTQGSFDATLPSGAIIIEARVRVVARYTGTDTGPVTGAGIVELSQAVGNPITYNLQYNDWAEATGTKFVDVPADGPYSWTARFRSTGLLGATQQHQVTTLQSRLVYSIPPLAPTLTSPIGTVGTLQPQLQTSPNNPTNGDPVTGTYYEVRRVSDDALMWQSTLQSGTSAAYGGTPLSWGVQYRWRAQSRNQHGAIGPWSEWQTFTPVANNAPSATALAPSGQIGTTSPTFSWSYSDPDGDAQAAYQLQVRRQSDGVLMWDPGIVSSGASSAAYGGAALSQGVTYEWRVRVQDSRGAWSAYTGWLAFTPLAVPNPPVITSPLGLIRTLTPTVSGTYQQGSGGPESAYEYEVRQGSNTIYSSGPVTGAFATGQAYGTNNPNDTPPTPPALAWGTSYEIRARSRDTNNQWSGWTAWVSFRTEAPPTTPTGLVPSGNAVTGQTQPTLSWVHNDPDGDPQEVAEIELAVVNGGHVTGYNPKSLTQTGGSHQVTETLTASPATQYQWRVRTRATAPPGFSPWSAWATFTVATAPTVTVSAPAVNAVVSAPALQVQWSMSGGGGSQASWHVRIYDAAENVLHDTGVQPGGATSYTLPTGVLRNGNAYRVRVTVVDNLSQTADSGLIPFTTSWTPPPAPGPLFVTPVGDQP